MVKHLLQWESPGLDLWVRKIPWRRKWQATPVLLPGKSPGQRRLVAYSPWGRKESDRTEQLQLVHIICSPDGASDKGPAHQCRRYKRHLIQSLGWENHLEEEMVTYSRILAWRILRSLVSYSPWGHKEWDMTE